MDDTEGANDLVVENDVGASTREERRVFSLGDGVLTDGVDESANSPAFAFNVEGKHDAIEKTVNLIEAGSEIVHVDGGELANVASADIGGGIAKDNISNFENFDWHFSALVETQGIEKTRKHGSAADLNVSLWI